MKSLFVFCFLLPLLAGAQLVVKKEYPRVVVGRITPGGVFGAELSYYVREEGDTICHLSYRNEQYPKVADLQSVSFNNEGRSMEKLYQIIKSVFAAENRDNKEYHVSIKLGEDDVSINNYRQLAFTYAWVGVRSKGFFIIGEDRLEKLFGKTK